MKKRILALVLALLMVVAILPTAALAAEGNANINVGLTLTGILTMRITASADVPFDTVEVQIGDDTPITATQAGAEWQAPLMAHQMRETIQVSLKNGTDAVGEPTSFTIEQYLNGVVAANPDNAALEALVTAVWDYGTCAANYANELGRTTDSYDVPAAVAAANPDLSAYAYEFSTNNQSVGASALLYLDEAVDLRVKFDAEDVDAVTVDGNAAETTAADSKVVWEEKEILPQNFGKAYAVKALKDDAEVFAVTISPLSYANTMLAKESTTDGLKNLLKSMCLYNAAAVAYVNAPAEDAPIELPYEEMLDKIQGGWIGQAVGVTWGYPTEFRYKYQIIPEADVPVWKSSDIHGCFWQDDLYVELPFMLAMNQNEVGVNYDKNDIAAQFRDSTMRLWHANMYAQKNLRNGLSYPDSGSYLYNRCAEDLDWQISSDFVGMVYPGQVSLAAEKAFELGHLTNYEALFGANLYGGFRFHNGANNNWVAANNTGIKYNKWEATAREENLVTDGVLRSDTKLPVTLGLARRGETAYVYMNGVLVWTVPWATLVPNIPVDSTMAVGLELYAGGNFTAKVSNYQLLSDTEAVDAYIAAHTAS